MINFQQIIQDLREAGITQQQIAQEVGLSQPRVAHRSARETSEPAYSAGVALVELHKKMTRKVVPDTRCQSCGKGERGRRRVRKYVIKTPLLEREVVQCDTCAAGRRESYAGFKPTLELSQ